MPLPRVYGRRGGPHRQGGRLSGGDEDPLAADHAQDRRGRRGDRRLAATRRCGGVSRRSSTGPESASRRRDSRRHRAEDGRSSANSFELIMGAKKDPVFGAVIMVGAGGIAAEVSQDRALELPPLNERLARRMLESLESWPLLHGYRGKPGVNIDRLIEVAHAVLVPGGRLSGDRGTRHQSAAGHARRSHRARRPRDHRPRAGRRQPRPYSHLAIRPYPEEYVRQDDAERTARRCCCGRSSRKTSRCGTNCWRSCSTQSLWFRFRYLFKETDARNGHPLLLHRLRPRDGDRGRGRRGRGEGTHRRRPAGGRRRPCEAEYAVLVVDAGKAAAWAAC